MTPRSEEFIVAAWRRLDLAEAALQADPAGAVSAAYYAMLYAARALLSEGIQRQRERADCEAWMADEGEGREVVRLARESLGVAESLL